MISFTLYIYSVFLISIHSYVHYLNIEEWILEEIVIKDCFAEFLRRIPRFQDLASRLKQRKVTDPFVGDNGCFRNEFRIIWYSK